MEILARLAGEKGKTVVLSIHQVRLVCVCVFGSDGLERSMGCSNPGHINSTKQPQPKFQIFRRFHRLVLLHDGAVAYQGPAAAAVGYFERCVVARVSMLFENQYTRLNNQPACPPSVWL